MPRRRFTEEQIAFALRQHEGGTQIAEIIRKLTVHILAAVAEDEARQISLRTKEALTQFKASGVQLGNPKPLKAARLARAANSEAAARHAEGVRPLAERKRKAGETLQEIADFLTGKGLRTRRGQPWSAVAVMRLLAV